MTYKELAELLRLGASFRPQVYRTAFDFHSSGVTGSCALGAIRETYFEGDNLPRPTELGDMYMKWPITMPNLAVLEEYAEHPLRKHRKELWSIIVDLNDVHRWTREDIADWLEAIIRSSS